VPVQQTKRARIDKAGRDCISPCW